MTKIFLVLLDWKFKITMINTLRAVMEKDNMQELMGNEAEIESKNESKEMLKIKNSNEMKNAFAGLTRRLHLTEERSLNLRTHE